ncbi:hypothetical protein BGZ52_001098 [Haplosporangium bisporale]|nr:hypothetical protein BGZ52_001098 [Haplosporangium bisporale]
MNPNFNESSQATATTSTSTTTTAYTITPTAIPNATPYTLPPLANPPSSAPTISTRTRTPHPASIRHSQSFEPAPQSSWSGSEGGLTTKRSSASLNLLSSSSPVPGSLEQDPRSSILPIRSSGFSNPFKKLQNTFGNKKSLEFGNNNNSSSFDGNGSNNSNNSTTTNINTNNNNINNNAKVVSSSSSANSLTSSWRSKGAEMLSKANWRSRKNSEANNNQEQAAPIFGVVLEDAVRLSHIPGTPLVPAVLHRCAEFLEAKGVQEVGLYRVPGSHASVQRLKRMFDTGQDYDLLAMDAIDPNDIATLLKLYLRELPNPLLPSALLEQFQSLLSTDRHICHTLRGILIRLPRPNYVVLSYLCHHLSKIAAHSDTTKMTVSNLGVVFAPTLSIGSILFKALLGGFYDGVDTPENREKGLKIVWGGLLQDLEFGVPDYDDEEDQEDVYADANQAKSLALPAHKEEYHDEDNISQEKPPILNSQRANNVPSPDTDTTFDYTHGQNTHPLRSESPKEDEDRLMSAMMQQEEKAVKGEPTVYQASLVPSSTTTLTSYSTVHSSSPPSHSTSTANMPMFSTTTTTTASSVATGTSTFDIASRPRDHTYFQDQATSSTSHHGLHISIGAGSTTSGSLDPYQSPIKSQETPRSASGAPQLPPLEGLSIAM